MPAQEVEIPVWQLFLPISSLWLTAVDIRRIKKPKDAKAINDEGKRDSTWSDVIKAFTLN